MAAKCVTLLKLIEKRNAYTRAWVSVAAKCVTLLKLMERFFTGLSQGFSGCEMCYTIETEKRFLKAERKVSVAAKCVTLLKPFQDVEQDKAGLFQWLRNVLHY